jgi:hypothetical protein
MDDDIERTLADPNHPIYKVMLGLVALLTIIWTQDVGI